MIKYPSNNFNLQKKTKKTCRGCVGGSGLFEMFVLHVHCSHLKMMICIFSLAMKAPEECEQIIYN